VLTFEQIKELIEMVAQHRLAGVDLENGGFRFRVDGYPGPGGHGAASAAPVQAPAPVQQYAPIPFAAFAEKELAQPAAPAPPAEKAPEEDGGHVLNSPIVGTFYRSPNPQSPSFVEVGQRVSKGQVLCIIEAMKLMNEIESDVDGVVAQIYPQNAQPVEFGEPLFRIKT
jgi:acetyl-CoA carboxylase biotin carboxyl carrier protein